MKWTPIRTLKYHVKTEPKYPSHSGDILCTRIGQYEWGVEMEHWAKIGSMGTP